MQVFKFGGASVKDASAVKNVAEIIKNFATNRLIVVVSAMGKTTNALEEIVHALKLQQKEHFYAALEEISTYHLAIIDALFESKDTPIKQEISNIIAEINQNFGKSFSDNYDYEYDQIVSLGEILSTKIVAAYLQSIGFDVIWSDARRLIRTDSTYRNGNVDWDETKLLIVDYTKQHTNRIIITQGFIGHTSENLTTTLGREGSDYTAAIFAYCTDAKDLTIWKDVPGMLNADPKYFQNTIKLDQISYLEAIELAYYGASVIHPKTIKPLQNKSIPLYVKSFISPTTEGTVIHESTENDDKIPSYIFKEKQLLVSVMPKDFSFIVESSLQSIFEILTDEKITVNLMQNSAVSFSFIVDAEKVEVKKLINRLSTDFKARYNEDVELVTIRHYNPQIISEITKDKQQLMSQYDRQTLRIVLKK